VGAGAAPDLVAFLLITAVNVCAARLCAVKEGVPNTWTTLNAQVFLEGDVAVTAVRPVPVPKLPNLAGAQQSYHPCSNSCKVARTRFMDIHY
jgi:hypothetical protein